MSNPIEEALELVLTDVEWYHKSPTKRVIIKALTALRSGELVVVDGERLNNLATIHYFDAGCIQEIKANPAEIRAYLRREEDTNAES